MNIQATLHGAKRMQQRNIPASVLNWLDEYGARKKSNRQCEIVYFDKKSKRQLAKELGPQVVKCIAKFLDVYAVLSSEGEIITTGYRMKRLKNY